MGSAYPAGAQFAGKYSLVRVVGEGGMGVVYEALHERMSRRVAIKVLRTEAKRSAEVIQRFQREARAASRLKSPHVARIIDVDVVPGEGTPFMVMELLEGHDLAAEMATRTIPIGEAVRYVLEACSAMMEAHALGIVHRDLKPANLFLAHDSGGRTVKVLDFGISKVVQEADVSVTTTQSSLGTPLYMSPEQVRSAKTVDARTDVWSLGVILFEILAGRPPFDQQSATAVVAAIAADDPPDIATLRPDLPAPLAAAIMKTLEKNPARRFQSVEEFADAIAPFEATAAPSDGGRDSLPSLPWRAPKELRETLAAGSGSKAAAPSDTPPISTPAPRPPIASEPAALSTSTPPASVPKSVLDTSLGGSSSDPSSASLSGTSSPPKRRAWLADRRLLLAVVAIPLVGIATAVGVSNRSTEAPAPGVQDAPGASPSLVVPAVASGVAPSESVTLPTPAAESATPNGSAAPSRKRRGAANTAPAAPPTPKTATAKSAPPPPPPADPAPLHL